MKSVKEEISIHSKNFTCLIYTPITMNYNNENDPGVQQVISIDIVPRTFKGSKPRAVPVTSSLNTPLSFQVIGKSVITIIQGVLDEQVYVSIVDDLKEYVLFLSNLVLFVLDVFKFLYHMQMCLTTMG